MHFDSSLPWERHLMSSICSFDDGSNEKSINQPKKSEDSESDMAWTTEFIPETCFFKGKTFRQQIRNLLNQSEAETLKKSLGDFMLKRNIDALLCELYPILSKQDGCCNVLWQFVLVVLTEEEKPKLKQRLFELVEIRLPDFNNNLTCTKQSHEQDLPTTMPAMRRRRRNSKVSVIRDSTANEDDHISRCENRSSGETTEPTGGNKTLTMTRRQRRRRASAYKNLPMLPENKVSPVDESSNSTSDHSCDVATANTLKSVGSTDQAPFHLHERRRRQKFVEKLQKNDAVTDNSTTTTVSDQQATNKYDKPVPCIKITPATDPLIFSENSKSDEDYDTVVTRNERRRSRRASSLVANKSHDIDETSLKQLQALYNESIVGDKKKKQRLDSGSVTVDNSFTLPATSIDDVIAAESREVGKEKKNFQTPANKRAERNSLSASNRKTSVTDGNAANNDSAFESNFRRDSSSQQSCRSPRFDAIFLDDSKQKKNYLSALKKKLPFSSTPKVSDTDTFLCELSAQFDSEMNLLDDIQIFDDELGAQMKFGEKWSYLPKPGPEPVPTNTSECVTNVDDYINRKLSTQDENNHDNAPRKLNYRRDEIQDPDPTFVNEETEVPPFPVNLDSLPSSGGRSMSMRLPDEINDAEIPVRSERVRRRRRRNPDNIAKRHQIRSEIPEVQDSALQRITESFESAQTPYENRTPNYQQDEIIYDIPKPTTLQTQRRSHINIEKRTRRSRANRKATTKNKRNSTELRMHVWNENDLLGSEEGVKLRSPSPVDQVSFFDKARKKNYRVSGISIAMEDVFSRAEEDLHSHSFSPAPENPPPMPEELLSNHNHQIIDPDETYAPLREEVLALGLAYEEDADEEEPQSPDPNTKNFNGFPNPSTIPPPPPLPPIAPPPPPPLSPPLMFKNTPPTTPPFKTPVKRINWEKIEPPDLSNTVWGQLGDDHDQINDVVKYLDLEEHFAMKKAKKIKQKPTEVRMDTVSLLAHKKAYNTSILLAHLKLSPRQICDCLLISGNELVRRRMDASHYKQLLMYAPDMEEVTKIKQYNGDIKKLNEADLLAKKLVNIPGYQLRLKALMFKHSFSEKEEEIQKNLEVVQRASVQLRKSRKLAKILEFVLAMGNHMNRGHMRIAKATGFRIHFLADIDSTKTSDNKLTFLHILARAVISKFPEVVSFPEEIVDVKAAARVTFPAVVEELQEQRKLWLLIRDNLNETEPNTKADKFKVAMETCLVRTNGTLKRLEQLQNATAKEFGKCAKYFGENPKNIGMQQFFKIFDEFTKKFEKSLNEIRKYMKGKPALRK